MIRHAYGRDYALADTHFAASFSSHRSDKIAIERVLPPENGQCPSLASRSSTHFALAFD